MTADTVGGVWNYAIDLAEMLCRRGWKVDLATMGAALTHEQRERLVVVAGGICGTSGPGGPGITLHESGYRLEWMADPWPDVAAAGHWLRELALSSRPDVVHLNQFAFGSVDFQAPTLVVSHSSVPSWWRAVRREAVPQTWSTYVNVVREGLVGADLVAAPTRNMLDSLRQDFGFDAPSVVLPNGRDPARYRPSLKMPFVLAAGRAWDEAKNLAALDAVAADLPWPVLLAGPSQAPGGDPLVARHVRLLGSLAAPALAELMSRSSIFAHPAYYEPFGLAVLEAAMTGSALVLGDIASLREVWGDAAVFVPPEDAQALRTALLALIGDGDLCQALGERARARSLTYSSEAMATAYAGAYALAGARRADRLAAPDKEDLLCES